MRYIYLLELRNGIGGWGFKGEEGNKSSLVIR